MSAYFRMRIEYEDSDTIVFKDIYAGEYPHFLEAYPDIARSKGLKVKKISVEKQFDEEDLLW